RAGPVIRTPPSAAPRGAADSGAPRSRREPTLRRITMPAPVPLPVRRAIWVRRQHGESVVELAAAFGLAPRTVRELLQRGRRRWASAPHETWQVDAAEDILLGDGTRACWLRVADEFTGAVLGTAVFPPRAVELGPRRRDPGPAAAGIRPVGPAGPGPGRQRL